MTATFLGRSSRRSLGLACRAALKMAMFALYAPGGSRAMVAE